MTFEHDKEEMLHGLVEIKKRLTGDIDDAIKQIEKAEDRLELVKALTNNKMMESLRTKYGNLQS
tara:strand:+ start:40 stop:231 length:192 start_codon:yes stop_codon:yes gene_type:complete